MSTSKYSGECYTIKLFIGPGYEYGVQKCECEYDTLKRRYIALGNAAPTLHPISYVKEGGSIGLDSCTCSYMSETGVAIMNACAHPAS
jgi:hypothetical protein